MNVCTGVQQRCIALEGDIYRQGRLGCRRCRYDRLRDAGLLNATELGQELGVAAATIRVWRRSGLLSGYPYNSKNECLFERPDVDAPVKMQGRKLIERRRFGEVAPDQPEEV